MPASQPLKNQSARFQFSIASLLVLTTVVGIIVAVPGGADLLVTLCLWLFIGVFASAGLMILQLPMYLVYRRLKRQAEKAESVRPSGS